MDGSYQKNCLAAIFGGPGDPLQLLTAATRRPPHRRSCLGRCALPQQLPSAGQPPDLPAGQLPAAVAAGKGRWRRRGGGRLPGPRVPWRQSHGSSNPQTGQAAETHSVRPVISTGRGQPGGLDPETIQQLHNTLRELFTVSSKIKERSRQNNCQ